MLDYPKFFKILQMYLKHRMQVHINCVARTFKNSYIVTIHTGEIHSWQYFCSDSLIVARIQRSSDFHLQKQQYMQDITAQQESIHSFSQYSTHVIQQEIIFEFNIFQAQEFSFWKFPIYNPFSRYPQ